MYRQRLDHVIAYRQDPSSVMRQDGLLGELKKALLNRLMAAEFDHHLSEDRAANEGKNHRYWFALRLLRPPSATLLDERDPKAVE